MGIINTCIDACTLYHVAANQPVSDSFFNLLLPTLIPVGVYILILYLAGWYAVRSKSSLLVLLLVMAGAYQLEKSLAGSPRNSGEVVCCHFELHWLGAVKVSEIRKLSGPDQAVCAARTGLLQHWSTFFRKYTFFF